MGRDEVPKVGEAQRTTPDELGELVAALRSLTEVLADERRALNAAQHDHLSALERAARAETERDAAQVEAADLRERLAEAEQLVRAERSARAERSRGWWSRRR